MNGLDSRAWGAKTILVMACTALPALLGACSSTGASAGGTGGATGIGGSVADGTGGSVSCSDGGQPSCSAGECPCVPEGETGAGGASGNTGCPDPGQQLYCFGAGFCHCVPDACFQHPSCSCVCPTFTVGTISGISCGAGTTGCTCRDVDGGAPVIECFGA